VEEFGKPMPYTPRERADEFEYVQPNAANLTRWLVFDVDEGDAFTAAENAGLLEPDIIVLNPDNHKGHLYYLLSTPVSMTDRARRAPIAYLRDVRRRMTRALHADTNYVGLMAKNPLHSKWRVRWGSCRGYSLQQLLECLPEEKVTRTVRVRAGRVQGVTFGGRNSTLFDLARMRAYRAFQKHEDSGDFAETVEEDCEDINDKLDNPMGGREVRQIAKSIVTWVGDRFSYEGFKKRQKFRATRRWDKTRSVSVPLIGVYPDMAQSHYPAKGWGERLQPWRKQGISRATYYRRKRQATATGQRPRAIRTPKPKPAPIPTRNYPLNPVRRKFTPPQSRYRERPPSYHDPTCPTSS